MYYKYAWGNNPKRATMKGRMCHIVATGKMGSVLIEFENGQREISSRRALRKLSENYQAAQLLNNIAPKPDNEAIQYIREVFKNIP